MHPNLKLINPLKENELFSVHKYKKMNFSNYSYNSYYKTIYKPFNTQKYSLFSLKKNKKFGVTLSNINHKNKTNYNLKQNLINLNQIPYPSFPNNKTIPAIYKNSQNSMKATKYPKIMNNNFTIYNYNKQFQKDDDTENNFLFKYNNINTMNNTHNTLKNDLNKKNKTYGGEIKFLNYNNIFNNNKPKRENKNGKINFDIPNLKKKSKEIKLNIKVNNFNGILDNIMRLIEMRDEHNNSIIYIKVTNLLLEEINKLLEIQKQRDKLKLLKNKGTSTYRKIKIKKRNLSLACDENDISFIKKKNKKRKSLNLKSIDLKFHNKYGFDFELDNSSLSRGGKSEESSFSKDSIFGGVGGDAYKEIYRNNKNYKNEYGQTNESIFNNNKLNTFGIIKENIKNKASKKNNMKLNNDNIEKNKIDDNSNKIYNDNEIILDNKNKGISIFNNFIKGNKKINEKKPKIRQNQENQEKYSKKGKNEKNGKLDFSNLLNNIVSKIEPSLNTNKNKVENDQKQNKNEIPIFEQMVKNDRLIKLINQYLKDKNEDLDDNYELFEEDDNEADARKIKIYNEYIRKNLVVNNQKIERRKRRAKTHIVPKIELGMEIIKHICNEINIDKKEKDNIVNCLFNLIRIAKKEKKTEKEENLQNKMLKPINEITQKYLENMMKINTSGEIPASLFSNSLKIFLRDRLKEILNIATEDNEEEEKKKQMDKKKRARYSMKKPRKKLVFDNSYFFKKNKLKRKESLDEKLILGMNKNDEDDMSNNLNATSSSFDNRGNKKKTNRNLQRKGTKFLKTKNTIVGLKVLNDEKGEIIENKENENKEEENLNENILDKRLKAFFGQIKQLKNIKNSKDEEKLKMFIDKEIDKFDYSQEKKIEARKYNFFNDLKVARIASKNGKNYNNNKLLFHSPIIFNIYKSNE